MSTARGSNVAASVRARLNNLAVARKEPFARILERYAIERLLYRLSRSAHQDRFVLKGASLFLAWGGEVHRPTRDVDLLGFGSSDLDEVVAIMAAIITTPVEEDGLAFPVEAITASRLKAGQRYEGVRLSVLALLDRARIRVQVDIGFGDAVTPTHGPFPALLDMPGPVLRLYPRETVIAEKFQALVVLDLTNTRLKDFYDLWAIGRGFAFDGEVLCHALRATFQRRETALPAATPPALTTAFTRDPAKEKLWQAFLGKNEMAALDLEDDVAAAARAFVLPPAGAIAEGAPFPYRWQPGGPWVP